MSNDAANLVFELFTFNTLKTLKALQCCDHSDFRQPQLDMSLKLLLPWQLLPNQ